MFTKENAKDYLPFVKALAEGKMIQARSMGYNGEEWKDCTVGLNFSRPADNYRVKADPEVRYLVYSQNGNFYACVPTEVSAASFAKSIGGKYKKFVEEL